MDEARHPGDRVFHCRAVVIVIDAIVFVVIIGRRSAELRSDSPSSQLSVGAKIGIGLGTILGLIYRLLKLKAPKKGGGGEGRGRQEPDENRTELPGQRQLLASVSIHERKQELITPYSTHEAEATCMHEVHGVARPSELPSTPFSR